MPLLCICFEFIYLFILKQTFFAVTQFQITSPLYTERCNLVWTEHNSPEKIFGIGHKTQTQKRLVSFTIKTTCSTTILETTHHHL